MMAPSLSRLAYIDCFEILDKAKEDETGVRVEFDNVGLAYNFRNRLHYARKIDRIDNAMTYDEGHPLYGRSVYDSIVIRITNKSWKDETGAKIEKAWITLTRSDKLVLKVESLSGEAS